MKKLLTLIALSAIMSFAVGCSDDDSDAPKVTCPSPSYLNGLIQQIQAIQVEMNALQGQLLTAQGADRDAINAKIDKARERENNLKKELNTYQHCF